ncbi:sensor histidine kinase [Leifsonia sp. NPDC058194]|uniref:sensor histidine kinase n=1 Tax=Leifsonia sp. NPDC058194 TaxID=3346374 RepID=UPI0036D96D85
MTAERAGQDWPRLAWFLRSRLMDRIVLIVCVAALVTEVFVLALAGEHPLGYLGVVLGGVGVALARYRPFSGLAVAVAGAAAAALLSTEFVALWSVVVLQLFSITLRGTRALPAFALAVVPVYFSIVAREGWDYEASVALVASACCAAAAAIGSAVCSQERYLASMRQRALDAEAAAVLAIEHGVAEERLRIARDLHDAVGHEIAVVSMSIGVAEVRLSDADVEAHDALEAARGGIQRVLQETQQILDVLRRGASGEEDNAPVADVSRIPGLVESLRVAGTSIRAAIGDVGTLDPGVSAAAFRIVQEALTNAQRHGIGTIDLSVGLDGDRVVVDVRNARSPGAATASGGSGYGLIGMRERTASVGGVFDVIEEPAAFRVRATLNRRGEPVR